MNMGLRHGTEEAAKGRERPGGGGGSVRWAEILNTLLYAGSPPTATNEGDRPTWGTPKGL